MSEAKSPFPTCFWHQTPPATPLIQVNQTWLCLPHASCAQCGVLMTGREALNCACEDYGYQLHETMLWCSPTCLDESHSGHSLEDVADDQESLRE